MSNQSGVARGFFTLPQLWDAVTELVRQLDDAGVRLDGFYWCPHHPDGTVDGYALSCTCRKPDRGCCCARRGARRRPGRPGWSATSSTTSRRAAGPGAGRCWSTTAARRSGRRPPCASPTTSRPTSGGRPPHPRGGAGAEAAARTAGTGDEGGDAEGRRRRTGTEEPAGMTTANLSELINAFPHLRVAVIGDVMVDAYLEGASRRLCREAPVPAVEIESRHDEPGGAANAAANVRALGAAVRLLGVAGDDLEGRSLRETLRRDDVGDDGLVVQPHRRDHRETARGRAGSDAAALRRWRHHRGRARSGGAAPGRPRRRGRRADAVLVSDYGYGTLTPAVLERLGRSSAAAPRPVVVDAEGTGCGTPRSASRP